MNAAGLDPAILAHVEALIYNRELTALTAVEQEIYERLCKALEPARHFNGETGNAFRQLIQKTIRFLADRHDMSRVMGGGFANYLFEPEDGKLATKERAVHNDYAQFLRASDMGRHIHVERPEIAGGRVDVLVQFDRFRIVVEIKRELVDASPEALRKYLGQSALYHATDIKLGILLVLDLTPRTTLPSLEQSIWVDRPLDCAPGDDRYIVVVKIPGNRGRPSDESKSGRRIQTKKTARA